MQTLCLGCKEYTDNIGSKKVIMMNKAIRDKLRCANFMSDKSRFLKQRFFKKIVGIILMLKFSYTSHYITYCLKCRKDRENVNSKVIKTKNSRPMLLSKCAVCGRKKSRFMKEQEAKGLLSNLRLKTSLIKILILSDISII